MIRYLQLDVAFLFCNFFPCFPWYFYSVFFTKYFCVNRNSRFHHSQSHAWENKPFSSSLFFFTPPKMSIIQFKNYHYYLDMNNIVIYQISVLFFSLKKKGKKLTMIYCKIHKLKPRGCRGMRTQFKEYTSDKMCGWQYCLVRMASDSN